jgi:hypothetical protein
MSFTLNKIYLMNVQMNFWLEFPCPPPLSNQAKAAPFVYLINKLRELNNIYLMKVQMNFWLYSPAHPLFPTRLKQPLLFT